MDLPILVTIQKPQYQKGSEAESAISYKLKVVVIAVLQWGSNKIMQKIVVEDILNFFFVYM